MAVTLKTRRGALSGLPSAAAGEPLFTTDQFRLYIGSAGGNRLLGLLNKIDGTAAPTVNDDAGDGFSVGSTWMDTTNDRGYVCVDSTVGAAVWLSSGLSLAANIAAFLATPSSANLRAALTDEVGTGAAYFVGGALGTPASGTLSNCDAFVAAGGSAAKGLVPSPGATAYTNNPRILGSQAAFVVHSGKIIDDAPVTTQESTSSTSFVDLTTAQSITFTLDEAGEVLVEATATYVNTSGAGNIGLIAANVDGSNTVLSQCSPIGTTTIHPMAGSYSFSLSSGSHTIKLRFRVTGGTGQFSDRNLVISLKS